MTKQNAAFGFVGLLIGFILGFFTLRAVVSPIAPTTEPAAMESASQEGLPPNHPSPQVVRHLQHLQEEAEKDPQNRQARVELGNAYYDMGRFDAATRWYEEALALDDRDVNVTTDLGTAHLYMGNTEKALELYQKSLSVEPTHPQTLQNIGVAYFASERYEDAILYWQKLIDHHPDYPSAAEIKEQIEVARTRMEG